MCIKYNLFSVYSKYKIENCLSKFGITEDEIEEYLKREEE